MSIGSKKDLSPYYIKTTDGGNYIAFIGTERTQVDKDYVPTLQLPSMWACGNMTRWSEKYPVYSWSIDSRYSSREGAWKNNWTSDYEFLYEFMTDAISDDLVNADKFKRLRERQFISENNQINIMVVKGKAEDFLLRFRSSMKNSKSNLRTTPLNMRKPSQAIIRRKCEILFSVGLQAVL